MATSRICSIPDCGKRVVARGWCSRHYDRWRFHGDPLAGRTIEGEPQQFINGILAMGSYGTECIEWPYARNEKGYGTTTVNRRTVRVHRYVCTLVYGDPPTRKHESAHSCGVRLCVNPRHLRWATHYENILDKNIHGTDKGWTHPRDIHSRGKKLSFYDAMTIRRRFAKGGITRRALAKIYNVTPQHVGEIVSGKCWPY